MALWFFARRRGGGLAPFCHSVAWRSGAEKVGAGGTANDVSMQCIQTHWRCAMDTAILTLRVPVEIKQQLDKLADATHRSKSWLAGEAIRQYLDLEAWQIGEIKQALVEADAGDFASDDELAATIARYAG
jgi:RHH-type rel operon transcriptional repressor/antitoxin RelB